jgi:flagellar biosynthesis anti-sigma factor FlgM
MKGINGNPALDAYQRVSGVSALEPSRRIEPGAAPASSAVADAGAAKVSISDDARRLAEARAGERTEKLDALKTAVEGGTLAIDPERIAARLLGVGE